MPTRRENLEAMLRDNPADSFLRYGLALELYKEGQTDIAVEQLKALIADDGDYQAAFFQLGQIYVQRGEFDTARVWLRDGIAVATRIGNLHAAGEMQQLLASLD